MQTNDSKDNENIIKRIQEICDNESNLKNLI